MDLGEDLKARFGDFCGHVFSGVDPVFARRRRLELNVVVSNREIYGWPNFLRRKLVSGPEEPRVSTCDPLPWTYFSGPGALQPIAEKEGTKWLRLASRALRQSSYNDIVSEAWEAKAVAALYLGPASFMAWYGLTGTRTPGPVAVAVARPFRPLVLAGCLYSLLVLPEDYMAHRSLTCTTTERVLEASLEWRKVWENAGDYAANEPHWEVPCKPYQGTSEKKETMMCTLWSVSNQHRRAYKLRMKQEEDQVFHEAFLLLCKLKDIARVMLSAIFCE